MMPFLSSVRLPVSLRERVQNFLRTLSIRNYLIGLGLAALLGVGYFAFAQGNTETQTIVAGNFVTVERQTLSTSVKATGTVAFGSEQELKFNQKGTVAKVNYKEGDEVKKGKTIAELDKVTALADIQSSQLGIAAAKLQLQQLHADYEKQVIAADNAVNSAQRSVEQATQDLAKTQETEMQSLASTAQDTLVDAEKLIDSFYSVLTRDATVRPPLDNYDLEIDHFLYRDFVLKQEVEFTYRDAVNQAVAMHKKYGSNLNAETSADTVLTALEDSQKLAETLQKLGEKTYTLLQGASTDGTLFIVDDLNTLRTTVNTNRGTAATLVDSARTAKANLVALTEQENAIPSATLRVKENTVATYQETQKAKEADRESTLTDLNIAISIKENDIAQKQVSLSKLYKALEDYRLTAPFDGVITHLDYKVGDNLLETGDTESLTLQNLSSILITIPLDQVDVVNVRKGMTGSIVFDAIPGRTFYGLVSKIDSTATTTSGVVSYDVSVELPTPQGVTILSGMTTTVTIETSRKENVLMVPTLALHTENGVITVQNASGESVTVTTGETNGQYTEILFGLSEGDSVLAVNIGGSVSSKSSAFGQGNDSMRLMRTLDGGGGPPR